MSSTNGRRTVLVTGCSPGGIGHSIAKEFFSKDYHVIATARDKSVLTSLEVMGMTTLHLDVTSADGIAAARKEVEDLTDGKLDILVNNAGRICTMPAQDVDLNDARDCFETNFFGLVAMTQAFVPMLIPCKGLIINIGSVAAIFPYVFGSIYNASKAAVHSFSDSLRLELEPYNIRVMVIVTSSVQSRITDTDRILPDHSLYWEINSDFQKRVKYSQVGAMPNEVFARGVVREALRRNVRHTYWSGNKSWMIWFVWTFFGTGPMDWLMRRMFGLNRLRELVAQKDAK